MAKRVRNVGQHVEEDSSPSDLFAPKGYRARVFDELEALHTELLKYRLPEEDRAWEVAYEARGSVRMCGSSVWSPPTSWIGGTCRYSMRRTSAGATRCGCARHNPRELAATR
jgi:hypothetical protein